MKLDLVRVGSVVTFALVVGMGLPAAARAEMRTPATPPELVASYDALADTILGANKAERKFVISVLAATYGHAQGELARARQALKTNDTVGAKAAIENLATAVSQIGTEGDNAMAGVRKRLLEGGHHANSEGEVQGTFDAGYVIVTKVAKRAFLDSSQALGMLARAPQSESLEAEWKKVEGAWVQYVASAK